MIIANQWSHTLDVLATTAVVLAGAAAVLTVITVALGMRLARHDTVNSTQTLSDMIRLLSKRGGEHMHRIGESKQSRR